jgi:formyl-CoA transferase
MVSFFRSINVPVSPIKPVDQVVKDPLVKRRLLYAKDPVSRTLLTLAPPPYMTSFLEASKGTLSFPPRFGEHNEEFFGERLGCSSKELEEYKQKGVI